MRDLPRVDIELPSGEALEIHGLSDAHMGAIDFARDVFRERVREIKSRPNALVVLGGDLLEAIDQTGKDKRASGYPQLEPDYQERMFEPGGIYTHGVEDVVRELTPIRDRIVAVVDGNHETKIRQILGRDLVGEYAAGLGVSHLRLGYDGYVRLGVRIQGTKAAGASFLLHIYVHHGGMSASRVTDGGNQYAEAMRTRARHPDADLIMFGHTHTAVGKVFDGFSLGVRHVVDRPWAFVNTGTYKLGRVDTRGKDAPNVTWEDHKMFPQKMRSRLGSPVVRVTPNPPANRVRNPDIGPYRMEVINR